MARIPERPTGFRTFLASPAIFWGLLVIVGLLVTSATRIVLRERELRAEERTLGEERRVAEAEVARLDASIRAGTSPEVVERLAKERLNMKNPGEEVVVVSPEGEVSPAPPPARSRFSLGAMFGFSGWLGELLSFLVR